MWRVCSTWTALVWLLLACDITFEPECIESPAYNEHYILRLFIDSLSNRLILWMKTTYHGTMDSWALLWLMIASQEMLLRNILLLLCESKVTERLTKLILAEWEFPLPSAIGHRHIIVCDFQRNNVKAHALITTQYPQYSWGLAKRPDTCLSLERMERRNIEWELEWQHMIHASRGQKIVSAVLTCGFDSWQAAYLAWFVGKVTYYIQREEEVMYRYLLSEGGLTW